MSRTALRVDSRGGPGPLILGLSGGTAPTRAPAEPTDEHRMIVDYDTTHDSAAVLVRDGVVLAAVEEERLNRLKHTNKIAVNAIRACLDEAGLTIADIDRIAYYAREDIYDHTVIRHLLKHPSVRMPWSGRAYLAEVLSEDLGQPIDPARLMFVEHHLAHASSAYAVGPFEDALVVTLDGKGDGLSGSVWAGRGGELTRLLDIPIPDSLGVFYVGPTTFLAYRMFDEYKVMGLAAYGDPSRYRHVFEAWCTLEPNGRFIIHPEQKLHAFNALPSPRRAGDPMTPAWQDFAAAAQEAVERAAMHLFAHYRRETGLRHLCLAGGVMHNSTLVGKVASSGLFDGVFVQPAASDAGCALGAALVAHRAEAPEIRIAPMTHAYLGPGIGDRDAVRAQVEPWRDLVHLRRSDDVAGEVATLIADGAVIGWLQGRSEFGPRALGNRSILADPRPAANKDRINELVKHREPYRPFAPAVLEEEADRYFEMPPGTCADYMTLTVRVRPEARARLGAVTHVDGSARVQTVSRATNPRFWALIAAFGKLTGLPVLLNTSFNHSVEPIVQSIDDAMTCYLTTNLTHLVIDDYIATRRDAIGERLWTLVPTMPEYVRVTHSRQYRARGANGANGANSTNAAARADGANGPSCAFEDVYRCEHVVTHRSTRLVGDATCRLLQHIDGRRTLGEIADDLRLTADRAAITGDIETLWGQRLIRLLPAATSEMTYGRETTDCRGAQTVRGTA
jgi:carbamoyltransferase